MISPFFLLTASSPRLCAQDANSVDTEDFKHPSKDAASQFTVVDANCNVSTLLGVHRIFLGVEF